MRQEILFHGVHHKLGLHAIFFYRRVKWSNTEKYVTLNVSLLSFLGSFLYLTTHFWNFYCTKYFLLHQLRSLWSSQEKSLQTITPLVKRVSYDLHKHGFHSNYFIISSSSSSINEMLYGGGNLLPIAVHHVWLSAFSRKWKYVNFKTTSNCIYSFQNRDGIFRRFFIHFFVT